MTPFNMKGLKGKLRDAVDTATSTVKDSGVREKLEGLRVADRVTGLVETAKDGVARLSEISVSDQVSSLVNSVRSSGAPGQQFDVTQYVPVADALSIFFYLMASDGSVHDDELDRFNSIFDEMSESCVQTKENLISACQAHLDFNKSSISPLIPAMTCVDQTLLSINSLAENEPIIPTKLLIWDLFAIAHSDGVCNDAERELISHIARHVGVDETTLLEMESTVLTIYDIEHELNWIKTTDKPYLVIESIVNELESRKAAAFEGAQALISL